MKRVTLISFLIFLMLIASIAYEDEIRCKVTAAWTLVDVNPEIGRWSMDMAYDSNRQVIVMFGGRNGDFPDLADTWEYDGSSWKLITTSHAPSARHWHAMAYDTQRQRVVLFGGEADDDYFGDTWEYDGTDWTQINTAHSPSPRSTSAMVYDSCRKKMVLFSGYNAPDDTWEYDGIDWTQISTAISPPGRGLAGMSFDSKRCKTVLFGGCCGIEGGTNTWEYDGVNWQKVETETAPIYRWGHSMVYDISRRRIVLVGGLDPESASGLDDTWEYDGEDWEQVFPSSLPPSGEQKAMAYDSDQRRVMLLSGDETWEYIEKCPLGDVTGDSTVSAYDAALILQFVVGIIDKFPLESMAANSPKNVTSHDYEISVQKMSLKEGQRIFVPININDTTGLIAGCITLKYNPTVLKALGIVSRMPQSYWESNTDLSGEVRFAFVSVNPSTNPNELLMVEFEALLNTVGKTSPLILEHVQLSNSLSIEKINGLVSILPNEFCLLQNYPNPFNPDTWLPYQLAQDASVTISIYNAKGQLIRTLHFGNRKAGIFITKDKAAYWNGKNSYGERVPSGMYFYTLQAGKFGATKRMLIVK